MLDDVLWAVPHDNNRNLQLVHLQGIFEVVSGFPRRQIIRFAIWVFPMLPGGRLSVARKNNRADFQATCVIAYLKFLTQLIPSTYRLKKTSWILAAFCNSPHPCCTMVRCHDPKYIQPNI